MPNRKGVDGLSRASSWEDLAFMPNRKGADEELNVEIKILY